MQRRLFLMASLGAPGLVYAHHGWSSFDQDRPIWLEGRVTQVRWRNPHAELELEVPAGLRVPPDLVSRALPPQTAAVDGAALLARAAVPARKDRRWLIELAPLPRLQAWRVDPLEVGASVGVLGFTFQAEKGDPILRAEYLFAAGKAYGLRSGPA
ncbi:MAG: hypothetical protein RL522_3016 [Pseudomonadota bacterium]|jgi:hypothetical protein